MSPSVIQSFFLITFLLLFSASTTAQSLHSTSSWDSPITGFAELTYGNYNPQLDAIFDSYFGEDLGAILEFQYDHYLYQGFGSAGVSFNIGYASEAVSAHLEDGSDAADDTRFTLLPLRFSLVYRFDYLQERYGIPIAFALQPGVSTIHYGIRAGGSRATANDENGEGWTYGYHLAIGGYFLLDFLAPGMGRSFDANAGVNHSYIFVEYLFDQIDDLGAEDSWNLSNENKLFGGIAFEF